MKTPQRVVVIDTQTVIPWCNLFLIGQTDSNLYACSKGDGIDTIYNNFLFCTDTVLCFPCNTLHQQFSLGQD